MDNQHKKIKGYRDLSQEEINFMNEIKDAGELLGNLLDTIETYNAESGNHAIDMRWLNIGRTDLQKGLMSITRAVARPDSF